MSISHWTTTVHYSKLLFLVPLNIESKKVEKYLENQMFGLFTRLNSSFASFCETNKFFYIPY